MEGYVVDMYIVNYLQYVLSTMLAAMGPSPMSDELPEADNAPWWAALERSELLFQRCGRCQSVVFYPRSHCPECLAPDLAWSKSSGRGTVYTFTVVHRAVRAFEGKAPYVVALVELDEGFRLMTNIVDCPPENVRVGMPVAAKFVKGSDGKTLPLFAPRTT